MKKKATVFSSYLKCWKNNHNNVNTVVLVVFSVLKRIMFSSGVKKNITIEILPMYIYCGLRDVILKLNNPTVN